MTSITIEDFKTQRKWMAVPIFNPTEEKEKRRKADIKRKAGIVKIIPTTEERVMDKFMRLVGLFINPLTLLGAGGGVMYHVMKSMNGAEIGHDPWMSAVAGFLIASGISVVRSGTGTVATAIFPEASKRVAIAKNAARSSNRDKDMELRSLQARLDMANQFIKKIDPTFNVY